MQSIRLILAAVALAAAFAFPAAAHDGGDADAIRHLMMDTFDKPEARLLVEPVVVEGDIAVTGWAQGDMGGRALLRRKDGHWTLVLCAGDALKDPAALAQLGLAPEAAARLAAAVVAAEAAVDAATVAKFSLFEGMVMMDEHGHHPQ